jgi:hypothetical protein
MQYTQTLRILNGLKVLAIVFACLYAFVVIVSASTGFFGHTSHITDKSFSIPLPALFAFGALVTSIFASIYGRTLSAENEEHLPVVWTRPVSRVRTALSIFGVNALGIVAAFALYMLLAAIFIETFQVANYVVVPKDAWVQLFRYLTEPFAFYALVMALTASTGRAGRGIVGWCWLGVLAIGSLASLGLPNPWHRIFNVINFLNPLAYGSYHTTSGSETVNVMGGPSPTYVAGLTPGMDVAALLILFGAGLALGLAQWRRLEA